MNVVERDVSDYRSLINRSILSYSYSEQDSKPDIQSPSSSFILLQYVLPFRPLHCTNMVAKLLFLYFLVVARLGAVQTGTFIS